MKIVFRTDSSLEIGSGHVVRCLTLAKALRERGATCHFICRRHPGNLSEFIRFQGFTVDLLDVVLAPKLALHLPEASGKYEDWLGAPWEVDALETGRLISKSLIDWMIVDHYGIDSKWEKKIRSVCRNIMVIDDLADRNHECDLILDQNLIDGYERRYSSLVPERCQCLFGPKYSLLQAEYAAAHRQTPPRLGPVSRVLVYFGGADLKNLTGMVIAAFKALDNRDIALDVVVNSQSPFCALNKDLAGSANNIFLHENLPSLCRLMIQADVAIGASGATSWERCCMGLPSYVVTLAENQVPIARTLHKAGFVEWLGSQSEMSMESFRSVLKRLISEKINLMAWSSHCRTLVDGEGAERVVSAMMLNRESPLRARVAEVNDEQILLEWANDPLVRTNSFSSDPIEPSNHRKWFYRRLRCPDMCRIYVVETTNGQPIGQVRFDLSDGSWKIDYSIGREVRGKGIAVKAMQVALSELRKDCPNCWLLGQVKSSNIVSQRVFEKLGFEKSEVVEGLVEFKHFLR